MSDFDSQNDELSALKSIYTEDEFEVFEENGQLGGKFLARIELSSEFKITYKESKEDDDAVNKEFEVACLPPIVLQFSLPRDYPSVSAPSFTLCCSWLNRKMLSRICRKLDELWLGNKGMEILFLWTQFLKEDSLSYLGIDGKLDVSQSHFHYLEFLSNCDRLKKLEKTNLVDLRESRKSDNKQEVQRKLSNSQIERNILSKNISECAITKQHNEINSLNCGCDHTSVVDGSNKNRTTSNKKLYDSRAVTEINVDTSIVELLKDYNKKQNQLLFDKTYISCQICFLDKLGQHCTRFEPCGHGFCKECITEYFEVQIKSGNVRSLICPDLKCNEQASQTMIKELVAPELFLKYESVLLNSTLETLTDIVYCPRTFCQYPVTIDAEEKMACCPRCEYVFCIFCRMVYHGVAPCRFRSGEKKKLAQQYEVADIDERVVLEKRYGKKHLQNLVDECMSENWIEDNSQNCPTCNVAIEKAHGCNKMLCWKCNTAFCWLCQERLNPSAPYLHFNNPSSPCFNLLFHGVHEEEDDDEFVEYMFNL